MYQYILLSLVLITNIYGNDIVSAVNRLIENPKHVLMETLDARCSYDKRSVNAEQLFHEYFVYKLGSDDGDGAQENFTSTPQQEKDVLQHILHQHPLGTLRECCSCCAVGLSRFYESGQASRNKFEQRVIEHLTHLYDTFEPPIAYVGFGSGGMFQDLVILATFLHQRPDAHLDIHLIDYIYRDFINLCKDTNTNYNMLTIDSETDYTTYAGMSYIETEFVPAQRLLSILRTAFPQATLNVHIHTDKESYIQYTRDNNIHVPTIIAAADLGDGDGAAHCKALCHHVVQNNDKVRGVILPNEVVMGTIFPDKGVDATRAIYRNGLLSEEAYLNDRHIGCKVEHAGFIHDDAKKQCIATCFAWVFHPCAKLFDRSLDIYEYITGKPSIRHNISDNDEK